MKYYIEKCYPLVLAIIIALAIAIFQIFGKDISILINQLADNSLSISVTLFGFLLTILTIINSIDTRRMKFVREMGGFPRLIIYLRNAISSNLILIAASFLIKYVEHRKGYPELYIQDRNICDYLFLFFFLYAMLASLRFTKIFISLLTDYKTSGSDN